MKFFKPGPVADKMGDVKEKRGFAFLPTRINKSDIVWFEKYTLRRACIEMTDNTLKWFLYDNLTNEIFNHLKGVWEPQSQIRLPGAATKPNKPKVEKSEPEKKSEPPKEEPKQHGRYAMLEKEIS